MRTAPRAIEKAVQFQPETVSSFSQNRCPVWPEYARSHYFIKRGVVVWAADMTETEVLYGRQAEVQRRDAFFREKNSGWWAHVKRWWNGDK